MGIKTPIILCNSFCSIHCSTNQKIPAFRTHQQFHTRRGEDVDEKHQIGALLHLKQEEIVERIQKNQGSGIFGFADCSFCFSFGGYPLTLACP